MNWKPMATVADVDAALQASLQQPQVVLKHSTRCNISAVSKARFERSFPPDAPFEAHLLLVVEDRPASNYLAETTRVHHESPQLLLLHRGSCVLEQSHYGIDLQEVLEVLAQQPA